jgi:Tfp pilus assembly protein PilO
MKLNQIDVLTIVMVLVVPVGAYFGLLKYRTHRLEGLNAEEEALTAEVADSREVTQKLGLARITLKKLEERIDSFMGEVTAEEDAFKAVGQVVADAKDTGVTIKQIRPGDPVDGRVLNYLPLGLKASAAFPQFYQFLRRVERHATIVTVNGMELDSEPTDRRCSLELKLRIYFAKPDSRPKTRADT